MKPPPADIRIDRDCRWFANGRPVVHEKIFKLFCASLVREQDSYFIRIGEQENPVIVEDVPFRVKSLFVENTGDGEDALNIYLNDDRIFRLDPATLRAEEGGSVYCSIPGTNMESKFSREALIQLGEHLEHDPDADVHFIILNGTRYELPSTKRE